MNSTQLDLAERAHERALEDAAYRSEEARAQFEADDREAKEQAVAEDQDDEPDDEPEDTDDPDDEGRNAWRWRQA